MSMHSHNDRKIKSCKVCQNSIKEINEAGKELATLGTFNYPKKFEKGVDYTVWSKK